MAMPRRFLSGWRRVGWSAGIAVITVVAAGWTIMSSVRRDLVQEAERELLLFMSLRLATLESSLEQLRSEMALWSDFGRLKVSLGQYAAAWDALGPDAGARLHGLYVDENPFPDDQRHLLNDAGDGSGYTALHAERQPVVDEFLEIHRYYDVFMADADGNVVYSYFKEPDFATNLLDGPWSGTGLAAAFRQSVQASHKDYVAFVDFARYEPSGGAPALFTASPAYDDDGVLLGVLAAQISAEEMNEIMMFTEGMGETGETYAVGGDLLMRSDSRFSPESDVLTLTADTESVRRALAGGSGVMHTRDYRDEEVIAAYGLLEFEGLRWAIIAEKDRAEILAPAWRLRRTLLVTGAVVVLLVGLAAVPGRDRPDWVRAPEFASRDA
jgi:methyl-accepting chemotaxis protein